MLTDNKSRTTIWRKRILERVALEVAAPWVARLQPYLGLWHETGAIPSPTREHTLVLPEMGTLTVRLPIPSNDVELLYSVSLCFGELRIGIVLPANLVDEELKAAVSECFGGRAATRISKAAFGGVLFDWIFRDEWIAHTGIMRDSLHDSAIEEMISDALATVLRHLIMSSLGIVMGRVPPLVLAAARPHAVAGAT